MSWVPEKFKRNPFIVWGFGLVTLGVAVFLFGQEEIMEILRWAIGMNGEGTDP